MAISVPGSTLAEALGIYDSGDIVGYYTDGSGTHGFLARGHRLGRRRTA
jgi:hypothetical protein